MMKKALQLLLRHRIITAVIILAALEGGYVGYKKFFSAAGETRYVFAAAQKGTLIVAVSGSGQVSASQQVDIAPKVSDDIVWIGVKNGQEVAAGTLIARLNSADAAKSVRDALVNLESARIALEKLKKPADALSVFQAENALQAARDNLSKLTLSQSVGGEKLREAKANGESDLLLAYEDGFNKVANAFLDLPGVMTGLDDTLFDNTIDRTMENSAWYANRTEYGAPEYAKARQYQDDVRAAYTAARAAYTKNFDGYKGVSRASDTASIEKIIATTYETTKAIAGAVKTADNYIDFIQDVMEGKDYQIPALVSTHQSSLDSYTGIVNTHLTALLSVTRAISDARETVVNAERDLTEARKNDPLDLAAAGQSVVEKESALAKVKEDADALDIRSAELTITQRENALADAREKLADYDIRAAFAGIIANTDMAIGDSVSPSTVLASLITRRKIAEIPLNEVDAADIATGQKATLTFDALPDLTLTGQVADIDAIGKEAQGVVTYNIKIAFDAEDERVKPGMSVSASIVTTAKQDVLLVPNSAIKTQGETQYVEMASAGDEETARAANGSGVVLKNAPQRQTVETGLANDDATEVITGLNEGDLVIIRTIQSSAAAVPQARQSAIRIPGLPGGGGGGGFRGGGVGR